MFMLYAIRCRIEVKLTATHQYCSIIHTIELYYINIYEPCTKDPAVVIEAQFGSINCHLHQLHI